MYEENNKEVVRNNGKNDAVSVGDWLLSYLIMCIPFVNIIMMFVWAFGKNTNPSKANYFKASLVMAAIGLVLSVGMVAIFGVSILGALSAY